jgi:hypothetical protein
LGTPIIIISIGALSNAIRGHESRALFSSSSSSSSSSSADFFVENHFLLLGTHIRIYGACPGVSCVGAMSADSESHWRTGVPAMSDACERVSRQ